MNQKLLCKFLGLHTYEVLQEDKLVDKRNVIIGKVIISRCSICGKIKSHNVYTEKNYEQQ